jgi:hypothetical protein
MFMKKYALSFKVSLLAVVLFFVNGFFDLASSGLNTVYITITTFLFSVFNGFFMARQSTRYSEIRTQVSKFDASMTVLFRESSHLDQDEHNRVKELLTEYYTNVVKHNDWTYYYFTHKTHLVSDLHTIVADAAARRLDGLRGESIKNMLHTLDDVQGVRKQLISLKEETIPHFQQYFMYMLGFVLLAAIATLPSAGNVIASLLKSVFMITILCVMILLRKFNDLSLFEKKIGEHSAQDVLDIMKGNK